MKRAAGLGGNLCRHPGTGQQPWSPASGPASASAVPVPARCRCQPWQCLGRQWGDFGVTQAMPDGRAHLGPGGNVWHLTSSEVLSPSTPHPPAMRARLGAEEMKAGRWKAPADSGMPAHPVAWFPTRVRTQMKTKKPEQEFDRRLVSRQGIVMLASSGMCTTHGKPPARSPEVPGTFPAGGQLPHTSLPVG